LRADKVIAMKTMCIFWPTLYITGDSATQRR